MDFVKEDECVDCCQKKLGLRFARMLTGQGNTEFLFTKGHTWLDPLYAARREENLPGPFTLNDPLVWRASIPQFREYADTKEQPRKSTLLLWEDGRCLSTPHCAYESIFNFGAGRYRHWGNNLYFTASDNSDPNKNGRTYTVILDEPAIFEKLRSG